MINNKKEYKIASVLIIIYTMLFGIMIPINSLATPTERNLFYNQDSTYQFNKQITEKPTKNKQVVFEQNNGQFDKEVNYYARGTNGYSLFLTATEAVYVIKKSSEVKAQSSEFSDIYMKLVGANKNSQSIGLQQTPNITNYFKGKESNWKTDIPSFKQIRMKSIYKGIDAVWHGKENGEVQYDFVLEPNANPNQIEWQIAGAKSIRINSKGDLIIETESGNITQGKPYSYQEIDNNKKEIESSFEIIGKNRIGFKIGNYDKSKSLIIDPTVTGQSPLDFSTVIGGSDDDQINAIEVGTDGKIYAIGTTESADFPRTAGINGNDSDAFIAVFSSDGTTLISSTVIGSDGPDTANDLKFDNTNGWVYLTGSTENVNGGSAFPTTGTGFDQTENGGKDAYAYIYQPSMNFIIYSSLLGSDFDDEGYAIELDSSGNFYIAGSTRTGQVTVNAFPTTSGAFDETHNGLEDVFVTKMSFNGLPNTHVLYSTFIGGSGHEKALDMKLDANNNVVITGRTTSNALFSSYPTTMGAFDTSHNGDDDVFVTKLNSTGSALLFSTFLGGDNWDEGKALTLDQLGNIYITGMTRSVTVPFPTTSGAFDETHNGGSDDVFVTKLNGGGSLLEFSTILGGNGQDMGFAIELDGIGNVLVGGISESQNLPITPNSYDASISGNSDAFLTRFNSDGTEVTYSTFIGGISEDFIFDIFVKSPTSIYFAGQTLHSGFPTTTGASDTSSNGGYDGFLTKFTLPSSVTNTAPYDFDGDNKTDISVYRPNLSQWWYLRSSDGGNNAFSFGFSSDIIVPGDYTGDGKTDVAFFRPLNGSWFILRSEDGTFFSFPFGATGDIPAPGDFDGDGITDATVYRPSTGTWFINRSSDQNTDIIGFGIAQDKPVVADYDGDGKDDIAIYRPSNSQWWINRSSAGVIVYQFGQTGDKTVQGDYTGDGKADVVFWRPSNGFWFVIRSEDSTFFSFPFGANGDAPSPGDYDGDGKTDAAVFRDSDTTWYINGSTSGTQIIGFGANGDRPIPNAYVYD